MVVQVTSEPDFRIGAPEKLFEGSYTAGGNLTRSYDVSDDERFLMIKKSDVRNIVLTIILKYLRYFVRKAYQQNLQIEKNS